MEPYLSPEIDIVPGREWSGGYDTGDVAFVYAMNMSPDQPAWVRNARLWFQRHGVPAVWHTIEDPNSFTAFEYQAEGFDVIATTDSVMVPKYRGRYPRAHVIWLPLAAQPAFHCPVASAYAPVDFMLIANYYENEARRWAIENVVLPLAAGAARGEWTFELRSYEAEPWPEPIRKYWRGKNGCLEVAQHYARARVVVGINNQDTGTSMTSMRTFEALACGRPFLAPRSDAYEVLGFENGRHFWWVHGADETVALARWILANPQAADIVAGNGRKYVLEHHTYKRRLETILEAVAGRAHGQKEDHPAPV